jgi:hypothetical protein
MLAFGLAILGLCIFAWGLKYKLSLYDPPHSVSHHIAAAKLLSGKERNAIALVTASPATSGLANSIVPLALTTLTLGLLAFATARFSLGFKSSSLSAQRRRLATPCARSALSFSRPPPRRR